MYQPSTRMYLPLKYADSACRTEKVWNFRKRQNLGFFSDRDGGKSKKELSSFKQVLALRGTGSALRRTRFFFSKGGEAVTITCSTGSDNNLLHSIQVLAFLVFVSVFPNYRRLLKYVIGNEIKKQYV